MLGHRNLLIDPECSEQSAPLVLDNTRYDLFVGIGASRAQRARSFYQLAQSVSCMLEPRPAPCRN
jgi:hypothetical protein